MTRSRSAVVISTLLLLAAGCTTDPSWNTNRPWLRAPGTFHVYPVSGATYVMTYQTPARSSAEQARAAFLYWNAATAVTRGSRYFEVTSLSMTSEQRDETYRQSGAALATVHIEGSNPVMMESYPALDASLVVRETVVHCVGVTTFYNDVAPPTAVNAQAYVRAHRFQFRNSTW